MEVKWSVNSAQDSWGCAVDLDPVWCCEPLQRDDSIVYFEYFKFSTAIPGWSLLPMQQMQFHQAVLSRRSPQPKEAIDVKRDTDVGVFDYTRGMERAVCSVFSSKTQIVFLAVPHPVRFFCESINILILLFTFE